MVFRLLQIFFLLAVGGAPLIAQNIKPFRELDTSPDEQKMMEIADYYITNDDYYSAIGPLQEVVNGGGAEAAKYKIYLADAYFNIQCYSSALDVYENIESTAAPKNDLFYYHVGLIYQGEEDYRKAISSLETFLAGNGAAANPKLAAEARFVINQCKKVNTIISQSSGAQVRKMEFNGSSHGESAVSCNGETIFASIHAIKVSEKQTVAQDVIVEIDSIRVSRLFSSVNGKRKIIPLNIDLKSNIGSPALSEDCNRLYYTVCQSVNGEDQCAIYMSARQGDAWGSPIKLNSNVNYPGYSSKNATLVQMPGDKSIMFFSSNRPGGKGDFDLWMSESDGNGAFEAPKNLGGLNTSKDEVTPFFDAKSGYLFFSSKGHAGLGGLDVYMAKIKWSQGFGTVYNLGKPINSGLDDFYFSLQENDHGYLTSNRSGCADDIYTTNFTIPFEYSRLPTYVTEVDQFKVADTHLKLMDNAFNYSKLDMKGSEISLLYEEDSKISGSILGAGNDLANHKVLLVDENGEVIDVAVTDRNGNFDFRKLPKDGSYAVILAEEDASINLNITIEDARGKVVGKYATTDKKNVFNYRKLDDYDSDYFVLEEDDASISGGLMDGNSPVANHQVMLVDEDGEIIDVATTDADGKFTFKKLPNGGKYSIMLDESDAGMNVSFAIIDENGNQVDQIQNTAEKEAFKYRRLAEYSGSSFRLAQKDASMQGSLFTDKGKLKEGGHEVLLVDESGIVVATTTTDKNGDFVFRSLPQGNFSFVLASSDEDLKVDILVLDLEGQMTKHISSDSRKSLFSYRDMEEENQEVMVSDAFICGTFNVKDSIPGGEYMVILVSNFGKAIDTVLVDTFGEFRFKGVNFNPEQLLVINDCMGQYELAVEVVDKSQATVYQFDSKSQPKSIVFKNYDFEPVSSVEQNEVAQVVETDSVSVAELDENKNLENDNNNNNWLLFTFVAVLFLGGGIYLYKRRQS
ncbi:SpaA isopeptide-forming pilin-related protein [Fulvivirga ligni]|uniref:SpaA isopeptide-forming pilin-related protein n=1 Tax=Fulvivirga ligni TaxID=2904246 RepID=UPI001F425CB1|nr:SpaA isopeptide-forming pilin-related protein [Fulvivirga ligni]UII21137.1 hypothetical protein LVD16_25195 [Fulvivirga ligni]